MSQLPHTWERIVMHADMDAFYAAVEQLDHPELQGLPVLVGPKSGRGVVLTASYEARPFGVGSAMPMAQALRRCPQAVVVPPRFDRYTAVSARIMATFRDFSPQVEALSLDEAFLEMSGAEHLFGGPEEMGRRLRAAVREATGGLRVSVGVSHVKYVAKVASGIAKPDGLVVVPPGDAVRWLAPLPVSRLWGAGPKTQARLQAAGYERIGDLAAADPAFLASQFGAMGPHFHALAHARDPRRVQNGRSARSLGSDRTLSRDVSSRDDVERHLKRSADRIARRLRRKGLTARGVRVRLKTADFHLLSRQCLLPDATDVGEVLFSAGRQLLSRFDHPGPFRLVGMAAFGLQRANEPVQLDLLEQPSARRLEAALDAISLRFGENALRRARDVRTVSDTSPDPDLLLE
jgi:DNA polymerase-4